MSVSASLPLSGGAVETLFAEPPTVEAYVREYFEEVPVLASIAKCESRFRQYGASGDIFRGVVNPRDVGVMQVNEHYHLDTAKKLNIDIYSLEGNLEYAQYLYEKEGTVPWNSSKKCWGGVDHLALR